MPPRTCDRLLAGIPCTAPGLWRPVVELVPVLDYPGEPLRLIFDLLYCDRHRLEAKLGELTQGPGWDRIINGLLVQGYLIEQAGTTLVFDHVRDEDPFLRAN